MDLHRSNCLRDLSTLQMEHCNGGASRMPLLIVTPSEFHLDPLLLTSQILLPVRLSSSFMFIKTKFGVHVHPVLGYIINK